MIIRSLTTLLGFKVDKTGVQQFERQIVSIRTGFTLATTAVGAFVYQTFQAVRNVGEMIADTDDLTKRTGFAFKEIIGLQEVAKQSRIAPEQLRSSFLQLTYQVEDARRGVGSLYKLVQRTNGRLNIRDESGNLRSTRDIFYDLVDLLSQIEDEQLRISAYAEIFDRQNAVRFATLFKGGSKELRERGKQYEHLGDILDGQRKKLDEYEKKLSEVESSLKNFYMQLITSIEPILSDTLENASIVFERGREKYAPGIGGAILSSIESFFKTVVLDPFFNAEQENKRLIKKIDDFRNERTSSVSQQNVNVDSTINIQVPPGTTEEQQQVIKESVDQAFREQSQEMIRQLQNNNPQVE